MILTCEDCGCTMDTNSELCYVVEGAYYCESCYDDTYYRCQICSNVRRLDEDWWWISEEDETRECNDCHQSKHNLSSNNPDITDSDRAVILKFAKQFVETVGVINTYKLRIKKGDYRMEEIKMAVGDIPAPIYLFGVKDEKEYRILATSDIIDLVKEYFKDKEHIVSFNEIRLNKGYMRLGLDRSLREIHLDKCIELVKYVSSSNNKKKMKKANIRRERAHASDPEVEAVPIVGLNIQEAANHIEASMLQNPNVDTISNSDIDVLNNADRIRFCYIDGLWEHVTLNIKLQCTNNGYRIIRVVPTSVDNARQTDNPFYQRRSDWVFNAVTDNPHMVVTMPEDEVPGGLMEFMPEPDTPIRRRR